MTSPLRKQTTNGAINIMSPHSSNYQLNVTIPLLLAGLKIVLLTRVGVLSMDKNSSKLYISTVIKIDNLRRLP